MCIFCDIIEGKIPSKVVYEDEDVMAILDVSQVTYGHTLVMPKKHVANILEADSYTAAKCMETVRVLAKKDRLEHRCFRLQHSEQLRSRCRSVR